MHKNETVEIEKIIGYTFKNKKLLKQAFTRRSYSEETGCAYDNELLEFIGDRVLDFLVVKNFAERYAFMKTDDTFGSIYDESDFTQIKSITVDSSMLSYRISVLGLNKYLIMGKGDIKNKVHEENHVKEDLFESIVGAVTIDSNWDVSALTRLIENMLFSDEDFSEFIFSYWNSEIIINNWCRRNNRPLPVYEYKHNLLEEESGCPYICYLSVEGIDGDFVDEGKTKREARMRACAVFYDYLVENDLLPTLLDEVGKPDWENAVNQLQELWQKGYIAKPEYEFEQKFDDNGDSLWTCSCIIEGFAFCVPTTESAKKDAKKSSAYEMLLEIFKEFGVDWDEYVPDAFDYDNDDL